MDDSCLICTEDFNDSKHAIVSCSYCQFAACRTCCQHYILDQEASVCMNKTKKSDGTYICQKEWSRKFVTDNFPRTWVNNEWKQMNSKVCVEREKALLPSTMSVVENRRELAELKDDLDRVEQSIHVLNRRKWALKQQIASGGSVITTKAECRGRACPDDACRGFLSSQWKCGLCDKWSCPDCHVVKGTRRDTAHTCDPDTLATVKLLDKDTKPCPKCVTPIHKIEGCDQMWCTQCHSAFSWRRGTIETRIHNPHFYEWQRKNNGGTAPRNIGDFECGRDLGDQRAITFITHAIRVAKLHNDPSLSCHISKIVRNTVHLSVVQLPRFQTDVVVDNVELRVNYLIGSYDEKKFASRVHASYKAFQKKKDITDVIQLQVQGITDIVYRLADKVKNTPPSILSCEIFQPYTQEMYSLTEYSNSLLQEHAVTYGCKQYSIQYESNKRGDVLV